MKNYIIILLIVIILVISTLFIANQKKSLLRYKFPVELVSADIRRDSIYLMLFFSKKSCGDCLEIVNFLNRTPEYFKVVGIVPENEIENAKELRAISKANFKLIGDEKFKKVLPFYNPTLLGCTSRGNILFLLASVPNINEYIRTYLNNLYFKIYRVITG